MEEKMLTPQWSHVLPVFMKVGIVCWSLSVTFVCIPIVFIFIFLFFNVIVYESV